MGQFDQFANQGGPAAESADALAEARRKADDQLRTADYSGDLPEPLPGSDFTADEATQAHERTAPDAGGPGESSESAPTGGDAGSATPTTDGGDGGD